MILYHSSNKDFNKIKHQGEGSISTIFGNEKVKREGVFLSDNPKFTSNFGNILYTVKADIKNTLDIRNGFMYEDIEKLRDLLNERWMESISPYNSWNIFDGEDAKEIIKKIKKAGYDSVILKEECHSTGIMNNTFVVFDDNRLNIINKMDSSLKRKRRI